jgi:hypothetical protein
MVPIPPRSRTLLSRGLGATVVAGLAVAAVAAAAPASAAGNGAATVTLSATSANTLGRTLVLNSLSGTALSTSAGLTATGGAAGFVTGVTDANYSNFGYSVQASMTNLYKVTGTNTYDCADFIPSSAVSVVENGALDLTNVAATVQPAFNLAGTVLGTVTLPANTPLVGQIKSMSATDLLGPTSGALADIADGSLSGLPVKSALGVGTTSTPFSNPSTAAVGSCAATGATPTSNPLLTGQSNNAGVKSVVTNALTTLGGGNITAGTLVSAGYTTVDAVKALVAPLVGGLGALSGLNVAPLSATVTGLQQITQSGSYQVSPTLKVTVPSSASGDYTGIMTVTLTDV